MVQAVCASSEALTGVVSRHRQLSDCPPLFERCDTCIAAPKVCHVKGLRVFGDVSLVAVEKVLCTSFTAVVEDDDPPFFEENCMLHSWRVAVLQDEPSG